MPDDDVLGQGATALDEQPPEEQDQPDNGDDQELPFYSPEELGQLLDRRIEAALQRTVAELRGSLDQHYRGTQSLVDKVTAQITAQVAAQLNREIGGTKADLEFLREMVESGYSQEDLQKIRDAVDLRRARAPKAEEPKPAVAEPRQETAADPKSQAVQDYERFYGVIWAEVVDQAEEQNVTREEVWDKVRLRPDFPKDIKYTDAGELDFKKKARASVRAYAAERLAEEQRAKGPRTRVETIKSGGGSVLRDAAAYRERLQRGETLPEADINAITARYLQTG